MAIYGPGFEKGDVKRRLMEFNRDYENRQAWQHMIDDINIGHQQAQQQLTADYADVTSKAYASYLSAKQHIGSSDLISSGKELFQAQEYDKLQAAYDAYLNDYRKNQMELERNRMGMLTDVDTELETQAENISKYATAHFDYLQWLWDKYEEGEHALFGGDEVPAEFIWDRYTVMDEDGNKRIMTKNELMAKTGDDGVGLFEDDGSLTMKGVDFFDQMQNALTRHHTFGEFLHEYDEELFDWSMSYNPYHYTEDEWGQSSQRGMFKTMVGMMPDDASYSFAERVGGVSSKELDSMFNKYKDVYEKVSDMDWAKDADKIATNIKSATSDLMELLKGMGIDKELEAEGITTEGVERVVELAIERIKSGKDIDHEFWSSVATMGGATAAAFTGAAGSVSSIVAGSAMLAPVTGGASIAVGVVAMLVGMAVGAATGAITGGTRKKEHYRDNIAAVHNLSEQYRNLVNTVAAYTAQKRRDLEISDGIDFKEFVKQADMPATAALKLLEPKATNVADMTDDELKEYNKLYSLVKKDKKLASLVFLYQNMQKQNIARHELELVKLDILYHIGDIGKPEYDRKRSNIQRSASNK